MKTIADSPRGTKKLITPTAATIRFGFPVMFQFARLALSYFKGGLNESQLLVAVDVCLV